MEKGREISDRALPVPAIAHQDILQKFTLNGERDLLSPQPTPSAREGFQSLSSNSRMTEVWWDVAWQCEKPQHRSTSWTEYKDTKDTCFSGGRRNTSLLHHLTPGTIWAARVRVSRNDSRESQRQISIQVHWAVRNHSKTRNISRNQAIVYSVFGMQNSIASNTKSSFIAYLKSLK